MATQRISAAEAAISKGVEGTIYQNDADPAILYVQPACLWELVR